MDQPRLTNYATSLPQWLYQAIGEPGLRLRIRTKGNNLHILCEGRQLPPQGRLLPRLLNALKSERAQFKLFLQGPEQPIYKIILYGRQVGQSQPQWLESIVLAELHIQLHDNEEESPIVDATLLSRAQTPTGGSILISNESLARTGNPEAIARYLSDSLSHLGVNVKVLIQRLPAPQHLQGESEEMELKRLWVICTCHYSPDASLLAEPIAQQLRDLELEGFKEAIIRSQVSGESEPDWILPVDLTSAKAMLWDLSRWGDIPSLDRLLGKALAKVGVQVRLLLKETTLHIFCAWEQGPSHSEPAPDAGTIEGAIVPLLEQIAPQGIIAATLYGVLELPLEPRPHPEGTITESPLWVKWLDLPASQTERGQSTISLAQERHPEALTFILQRALNPDWEGKLATGGIRVRVCDKDNLLHIMTEAVVCPRQTLVTGKLEAVLKRLAIPNLAGVRIYGRRSGQSSPLWSYGLDFAKKPVHEPIPSQPEPVLVPETREEVSAKGLRRDSLGWHQWITRALSSLPLFVPIAREGEETEYQTFFPQPEGRLKLVVLWSLLGIFLTVQLDWVTGRWLINYAPPEVAKTVTEGFALSNSFESPPATAQELPKNSDSSGARSALLAAARSDNPSFNNTLLDEKLALYQERVKTVGVPDVLIVGSSRAMRGIDPEVLRKAIAATGADNVEIFNFGINGATAQVVDLLLRRILPPEQLPKLIIWADGARAFNSGRPDATYQAIVSSQGYQKLENSEFFSGSSSPGVKMAVRDWNKTLNQSYKQVNQELTNGFGQFFATYPQRAQFKDWLRSQFSLTENSSLSLDTKVAEYQREPVDPNGFLPLEVRFDPHTYYLSHPRVGGAYDNDYDSFALLGQQEEALQAVTMYLQSQGVSLVFVNLPLTRDYLDPVRWRYEQIFKRYLEEVSVRYNFGLLNLVDRWLLEHDYFSDPSHLNRYGAHQVSLELAKQSSIPW